MTTVPNRAVLEVRDEATSDISRWPKKRSGAATLSRRKITTNTLNIITDRYPKTEEAHRSRRSRFPTLAARAKLPAVKRCIAEKGFACGAALPPFSAASREVFFPDILSRNWLPE
jgi:hypothetical protein